MYFGYAKWTYPFPFFLETGLPDGDGLSYEVGPEFSDEEDDRPRKKYGD